MDNRIMHANATATDEKNLKESNVDDITYIESSDDDVDSSLITTVEEESLDSDDEILIAAEWMSSDDEASHSSETESDDEVYLSSEGTPMLLDDELVLSDEEDDEVYLAMEDGPLLLDDELIPSDEEETEENNLLPSKQNVATHSPSNKPAHTADKKRSACEYFLQGIEKFITIAGIDNAYALSNFIRELARTHRKFRLEIDIDSEVDLENELAELILNLYEHAQALAPYNKRAKDEFYYFLAKDYKINESEEWESQERILKLTNLYMGKDRFAFFKKTIHQYLAKISELYPLTINEELARVAKEFDNGVFEDSMEDANVENMSSIRSIFIDVARLIRRLEVNYAPVSTSPFHVFAANTQTSTPPHSEPSHGLLKKGRRSDW